VGMASGRQQVAGSRQRGRAACTEVTTWVSCSHHSCTGLMTCLVWSSSHLTRDVALQMLFGDRG